MYDSYNEFNQKNGHKVMSDSSYQRKLKAKNVSFAKLGHEQCHSCLKFEVHECLGNDIENTCKCCDHPNKQQVYLLQKISIDNQKKGHPCLKDDSVLQKSC